MKKIIMGAVLAASLLTVMTGCSGGGGGSDAGTTTSSLSFPSNSVEANATVANAQEVTISLEQNTAIDPASGFILSVSQSDTSSLSAKNAISTVIKNIDLNEIVQHSNSGLNEVVNESYTDSCSGGGTNTLSISGTADENTGNVNFTASMNMNNCEGMNGSMSIALTANLNVNTGDLNSISKFNLSIGSNGLSYPGGSMAANSLIQITNITVNSYNELTSFTMNMTYQATVNSETYGAQALVVNVVNSNNGYDITQDYVSGKVYINDLGSYVTVDNCLTPITQLYSNYTAGDCRFNAANNGKVKMYVSGSSLMVAIDPENDGTFEAGVLVQ